MNMYHIIFIRNLDNLNKKYDTPKLNNLYKQMFYVYLYYRIDRLCGVAV